MIHEFEDAIRRWLVVCLLVRESGQFHKVAPTPSHITFVVHMQSRLTENNANDQNNDAQDMQGVVVQQPSADTAVGPDERSFFLVGWIRWIVSWIHPTALSQDRHRTILKVRDAEHASPKDHSTCSSVLLIYFQLTAPRQQSLSAVAASLSAIK